VYVGTYDGFVLALDRRTGRRRWRFAAHAGGASDPLPVIGLAVCPQTAALYVTQQDEPLITLDARTGMRKRVKGKPSGAHEYEGQPVTPLALGSDGVMVYGVSGEGILAISSR
jgi:outer membrane protein assembly factor BamB